MRNSIKEEVGGTVQDMLDSGAEVSFTKKELDLLGVTIPPVQMTGNQIQAIRKKLHLSQSVFAELLNVSASSIRQWEQGKRTPSGSTKVLLELLNKSPHVLDYRLSS